MPTKRHRRSYTWQFSLRTFLEVSIAFGLLVGWWVDHQRMKQKTTSQVQELSKLYAWIEESESEIRALRKRLGEIEN